MPWKALATMFLRFTNFTIFGKGGGRKGRGQRLYGRGRREAEAEDDEQWPRPHRPFPPAQLRREFAGIQEAFTELYQMLAVILNMVVMMSSNVPEWARQAAENHPPPEQAAQAETPVPAGRGSQRPPEPGTTNASSTATSTATRTANSKASSTARSTATTTATTMANANCTATATTTHNGNTNATRTATATTTYADILYISLHI